MKYFSIIIPFLKFDRKLFNCLESLVKQNFTNFETIIIYNGTKKISLNLKKKKLNSRYPNLNLNLLVSKRKKNISYARNKGIKKSKGNYIIFLDSDDEFVSNSLLEIYNELKKKEPEISIYNYLSKKKNKITKDLTKLDKNNLFKNISDIDSISLTCWRFIVKKKFLTKNKIYFHTKLLINEDNLFSSRLIYNCKNFLISKKVYYIYNHNPIGATNLSLNLSEYRSKIIKGSIINLKEILKLSAKIKKKDQLKLKFFLYRIKDIFLKNFIFSNLEKFQNKNKLEKFLNKKEIVQLDEIIFKYFKLSSVSKINKVFFNNIDEISKNQNILVLFSYTHISSLISKYLREKNIDYEIIDNSKILKGKKLNKKKINSFNYLSKTKFQRNNLIICHTSNKINREIKTQISKKFRKRFLLYEFEGLLKNNDKNI